ncbi:MAG: hypothetical protein ACLQFW_15980 [Xanthobacteraceae bacterium]
MTRRRPGEVTRAILECFHAHPSANAVEIGELCQVAPSYVCTVLRANGLTTLTRRPPPPANEGERRDRRNQWEARRRERINSNPETREAALAARRIYEQRRRALASAEEIEKERERCRLKARRQRAARKATKRAEELAKQAAEAARQVEEAAKREAARQAKEAALKLAAKLPEARIRTEAEIIAEDQARKCRRMHQRRGEGSNRSVYLREWQARVSRI